MPFRDEPDEEKARQDEALAQRLLQEQLHSVLQTAEGRAVLLHILHGLNAFLPTDTPDSLARRDFAEDFFTEIETVNPAAALQLFAALRNISLFNEKETHND